MENTLPPIIPAPQSLKLEAIAKKAMDLLFVARSFLDPEGVESTEKEKDNLRKMITTLINQHKDYTQCKDLAAKERHRRAALSRSKLTKRTRTEAYRQWRVTHGGSPRW